MHQLTCEWLKIKETSMKKGNPLPKLHNKNKNMKIISKVNSALKKIISANEVHIIDLKQLYSPSTMIATNVCYVNVRKREQLQKHHTWQERIQNHIELPRSHTECLKSLKEHNNMKTTKIRKL